jgi:hypothetical protein
MLSRKIQRPAIGLACLFLTACAPRLVLVEQCPDIPAALTEACQPAPREIVTNGDLARAYLDAVECVDESALKLGAIRELSECRADARAPGSRRAAPARRLSNTGALFAR